MSVCFQFEAIGTHWQIELASLCSLSQEQEIYQLIRDRIERFEGVFSRFRPDSLVARIAQSAGVYEFPPEAELLFGLYRRLYQETNGSVTPLIGSVLVAAGYDATYSFQSKALTIPPSWDEVMNYHVPYLTTTQPVQLDFGAAGKGLLVDLIGELVEAQGIAAYTIDAGGDMRYREASIRPLRVGLEHPQDKEQVIGVVALPSVKSICGSAGNRRAWGRFHHVIDPHKLASPQHILAIWVIADTTILADGMTTKLFLSNREDVVGNNEYEYCILYQDFTVQTSPAFPAELFVERVSLFP